MPLVLGAVVIDRMRCARRFGVRVFLEGESISMSDIVRDDDVELDGVDEVTQSAPVDDGDGSEDRDSPVSWDEIMSGDESGSSLEHDGVDDGGALVSRVKRRRTVAGFAVAGVALAGVLAAGGAYWWDHHDDVAVPSAPAALSQGVDPCAAFTSVQLSCSVEQVTSGEVARDMLVSQSLAAGATVNVGDSVVLSYSAGPESAFMPDVSGMTVEEATKALYAVGVSVGEVRQVEAGTVPVGTVTGASVAAGLEVSNGDSVTLDVASGRVNLPDWKGKTREYVESDAKKIGVSVSFSEQESDGAVGVVLSQSAPAGEVDSGTEVSVVLSKAKADPEVAIPNVVGLSSANAQAELVKAGFSSVTVVTVKNSEVTSEQVTHVVPAAGSKAKASTPVTVVVSQPYASASGDRPQSK